MEKVSRSAVFSAAEKFFEETKKQQQPFVAGKTYIPVTAKTIDFPDLQNVLDAALDMWFTAGRFATDFETEISKYFNHSQKALMVNSGSSANLLAVSSLCSHLFQNGKSTALKEGDEVITAAAGFPTTVNPILQNGLKVVFVDVQAETLNANMDILRNAITDKTKAIVLAHTLGNPYRADLIKFEFPHIALVEDCCDALGAEVGFSRVGSFGEYATCSFYPAHHITMGEGGAVMSATPRLRKIAESIRDWGRDCWCESGKDNTCQKRFEWKLGELPRGYDHKYTYSHIGYNLKSTDLQASLGLSQLKKADQFIAARRKNWQYLNDAIASSPVLSKFYKPVMPTEGTNPSWFGFAMYCESGLDRNSVVRFLENEKKIGTRLLFGGNLTKQPAYAREKFEIRGALTNTDRIMNDLFWVGVHPGLDQTKLDYILESLEAGTRL